MNFGRLAKRRTKKHSQKTLVEYDQKLLRHMESIEDQMFDRETRNSTLRNGEFNPPSGTLFEAIYKELKHREEHEKHNRSLSKTFSKLREDRAKKQIIGFEQNR